MGNQEQAASDSRIEAALARKRTVQRKEIKAVGKEGEHLTMQPHALRANPRQAGIRVRYHLHRLALAHA